jgi:hypothetical protein
VRDYALLSYKGRRFAFKVVNFQPDKAGQMGPLFTEEGVHINYKTASRAASQMAPYSLWALDKSSAL